jgi:hypothetical protein
MSYNADLVKNIISFAHGSARPQQTVADHLPALYGDRRGNPHRPGQRDRRPGAPSRRSTSSSYQGPRVCGSSRSSVKPRADHDQPAPQAAGRRVRDLVEVLRKPRAGNYTHHPKTATSPASPHDITKDDWSTTFDLWSATVYQTYASAGGTWPPGTEAAWFF